MSFDYVKSENISMDWLQGHLNASSLVDLLIAFSEIGFSPDGFSYLAGFNTRFYRNTFTYEPCFGDIRIMYNASSLDILNGRYVWTDGKLVDHVITINDKCHIPGEVLSVPSFFVTDREELNQHFYISVSGDGLRYLRSEGLYFDFLRVLRSFDFQCTRLDIALDIYDRDNDIVPLIDSAFAYEEGSSEVMVTTNMNRHKNYVRFGNLPYRDYKKDDTFNLAFGNHGSNSGMLRLYDKLHEMLFGKNAAVTSPYVDNIDYWYRFELEAHNDLSRNLFNYIIDELKYNLAPAFAIISERLFRVRVANWSDHSYDRYEYHSVYQSFLSHMIQNIELVSKFEVIKRPKRVDSWRYYVLNMSKVFYAINYCLSRSFIDELEHFTELNSQIFDKDRELVFRCDSFKEYYLQLGASQFMQDNKLIERCRAFSLHDDLSVSI